MVVVRNEDIVDIMACRQHNHTTAMAIVFVCLFYHTLIAGMHTDNKKQKKGSNLY